MKSHATDRDFPNYLLTMRQLQVLTILTLPEGQPLLDMDQLLELSNEKLGKITSKQAMQFILRAMIRNRIVEKVGPEIRRGRNRVLIKPTKVGRAIVEAGVVNQGMRAAEPGSIEAEVEELLSSSDSYL